MAYGWKDWNKVGFHHGRDEYMRASHRYLEVLRSRYDSSVEPSAWVSDMRHLQNEMARWYKPWWSCSGAGPYSFPDGPWDQHIAKLLTLEESALREQEAY